MKQFFKGLVQPLLISVFFAFFLFSSNVGEAYFAEFLVVISFIVCFVGLALKFINLFFNNYTKSSIFLSTFLIVFCYLSPILESIKQSYGGEKFFRARYFLIPCIIFLFLLFIKLKRSNKKQMSGFFSRFLILPFLFLISLYVVKICISEYKINRLIDDYKKENNIFRKKYLSDCSLNKSVKPLPNIYFIILDCYASHDVMLKVFGYDNSDFLNKLKKLGFFIADKCYSNYPSTFCSIPATLNMNYSNDKLWRNGSLSYGLSKYIIANNNVAWFLKNMGYKYYLNPSHWGLSQFSKNSDFDFGKGVNKYVNKLLIRATYLSGFTSIVLENTLIAPLWRKIQNSMVVYRVKSQLEYLKSFSKEKGPFFIFSHIVCPHGPYLFNADGSPSNNRWWEDGIPSQAEFISREIYKVVEQILKDSYNPPIIILQADHALGTDDLSTSGILNAWHLPDKKSKQLLYSTISPINNFRFIFDNYFGVNLGLLKDDYFVWKEGKGFAKITK
jgi:hypothetical protein